MKTSMDAREAVERINASLEHGLSRLRGTASEIESRLMEDAQAVYRQTQRKFRRGARATARASGHMVENVRQHPLPYILGAAAVLTLVAGFLLVDGKCCSRERS